jgi:hypothetical protein
VVGDDRGGDHALMRPRLSFANVTSTLAVFVALSGGAYAAANLPPDSVGTKQIQDRAVKHRKLGRGAVRADVVAANSLRGPQIDESTLVKVPSAKHADGAFLRAGQVKGANVAANALTGTHVVESSLGKVLNAEVADFVTTPAADGLQRGTGRTLTSAQSATSGPLGSSGGGEVFQRPGLGRMTVTCGHGHPSIGSQAEVSVQNRSGSSITVWANGSTGNLTYNGLHTYTVAPTDFQEIGLSAAPQQVVVTVSGPGVSYTTVVSVSYQPAPDDATNATCRWISTTKITPPG